MIITTEIQKRSEKIQNDLSNVAHESYMKGNPSLDYQDCMNVSIFTKLAELELQLELQNNQIQTLLNLIRP